MSKVPLTNITFNTNHPSGYKQIVSNDSNLLIKLLQRLIEGGELKLELLQKTVSLTKSTINPIQQAQEQHKLSIGSCIKNFGVTPQQLQTSNNSSNKTISSLLGLSQQMMLPYNHISLLSPLIMAPNGQSFPGNNRAALNNSVTKQLNLSASKQAPIINLSTIKSQQHIVDKEQQQQVLLKVISQHSFPSIKLVSRNSFVKKLFNGKGSAKSKNYRKQNQKIREKRVEWKEYEFDLLRAQSLLGFSRKSMASVLNRDDRLIFSKLQKHILNLIAVEKFIKETQASSKHDNVSFVCNAKQTFQKLQKYYFISRHFWLYLNDTMSHSSITEFRSEQSVTNEDTRDHLEQFIPAFLRVSPDELTMEQLHVLISQGLNIEQAKQTLKCIELEKQAHSRDAGSLQNGIQQKFKKESPSSSPDYDNEDKMNDNYRSVKETKNIKDSDAFKQFKTEKNPEAKDEAADNSELTENLKVLSKRTIYQRSAKKFSDPILSSPLKINKRKVKIDLKSAAKLTATNTSFLDSIFLPEEFAGDKTPTLSPLAKINKRSMDGSNSKTFNSGQDTTISYSSFTNTPQLNANKQFSGKSLQPSQCDPKHFVPFNYVLKNLELEKDINKSLILGGACPNDNKLNGIQRRNDSIISFSIDRFFQDQQNSSIEGGPQNNIETPDERSQLKLKRQPSAAGLRFDKITLNQMSRDSSYEGCVDSHSFQANQDPYKQSQYMIYNHAFPMFLGNPFPSQQLLPPFSSPDHFLASRQHYPPNLDRLTTNYLFGGPQSKQTNSPRGNLKEILVKPSIVSPVMPSEFQAHLRSYFNDEYHCFGGFNYVIQGNKLLSPQEDLALKFENPSCQIKQEAENQVSVKNTFQ